MHVPVLMEEAINLLAVKQGGRYIDGTVGLGGHAEALLSHSSPDGQVLGIDRDPEALKKAGARLAPFASRLRLEHGNYADMRDIAGHASFTRVDGVLLDLGVSSMQLDDAARGFSFMRDGPLDMRMDTTQTTTAADLVNRLDEAHLADLIFKWGEEPASRRIAAAIVRARANVPITTTKQLADVVTEAKGGRRGKIHPATQTFQALRMAVNEEFQGWRRGVEGALDVLRPGGRLAVITFHSLEDREVKRCLREHESRQAALPEGGSRETGRHPLIIRVNRKALAPRDAEMQANPRARSAKLRVVERKS